VESVLNLPCKKITEELGTPVRKITYKMLEWSEQVRMC